MANPTMLKSVRTTIAFAVFVYSNIDLVWKMVLKVYSLRRKMRGEGVAQWSDLPHDLLSRIASGLGLIDFLSFRGVCKDWRVASSKVSPQGKKSLGCDSWFLMHGEEGSQCSLILSHQNKRYTINIPELDGATCLASYEGWLLLFRRGSLFFFCPFSRATIELPNCPFAQVTEHVAALSSAPTSQDCTVAVVNRISDSELELFMLRRGEKLWIRAKHSLLTIRFNTIRAALFYKGDQEFHFLDGENGLVTFNASKTKQWKEYHISYDKSAPAALRLHYMIRKNHFQLQDNKRKVGLLEPNVSISTCGTVIPHASGELDMIIQSESIEPATQPESCHHRKGIWIQPRYFYVPPGQRW